MYKLSSTYGFCFHPHHQKFFVLSSRLDIGQFSFLFSHTYNAPSVVMHLYSHDTIKKIIRFDTWELYVLCLGFETLSKVYGD